MLVPPPSPVRPCAMPACPRLPAVGVPGPQGKAPELLSDPGAAQASMSPVPSRPSFPTVSGCNGLWNAIYCA